MFNAAARYQLASKGLPVLSTRPILPAAMAAATSEAKTGLHVYTYPTANGLKATVCLEELQVPYTLHVVDLTKSEQQQDWYKAISPLGKIPSLVDEDAGGKSVWESAALIFYLSATKDPKHILVPEDPMEAAQVLSWLSFQSSYMASPHGAMFVALYFGLPADAAKVSSSIDQLRWCWDHLEKKVAEGGGWLVGGRYTAADAVFAAAVVTEAALLPAVFTEAKYPKTTAWMNAMLEREGVRRGLSATGPCPFDTPGPERDEAASKAEERLAAIGLNAEGAPKAE